MIKKYIAKMVPLVKNIKCTCQANFDLKKCLVSIDFTLPLLKNGIPYHAFNPSIVITNEGYDDMCRASNWTLPGYRPIIPGDPIRNKIFFLRYDKQFNLLSDQEIFIPPELSKKIVGPYKVADCRIFHWNGSCWFIGNSLIEGRKHLPKVALCRFDCFDGITSITIQSLQLFYGPEEARWEKIGCLLLMVESLSLFIHMTHL